jgi:pentatricopeptide repeat protein
VLRRRVSEEGSVRRYAKPDNMSWNTVITGCVKNGRAERAPEVFQTMVDDGGVGIDRATVVSVVPACAQAKDLRMGRVVHR